MARLVLYLCLIFPEIVFGQSQNLINGIVVDVTGGLSLEYASVVYLHNHEGTISNKQGTFVIRKIIGDSIKISAVGYISSIIKIDSFTSYKKIELTKNYLSLPPVVIKNKPKMDLKHIELGHYKKQNDWLDLFGYKEQKAVFIPNENEISGYIESIKFKLSNYKQTEFVLRIRLLTVDTTTGLPERDLITEDNILAPSSFKHFNQFSVKSKSILLPPEGIFVSFEWLPVSGNETLEIKPPYVLGNTSADGFYVYGNYKERGWFKSTRRFHYNNSIGVPNISIIVKY